MVDLSSYLQYLPPVLWSPENDPQQFLGQMLRIFEKMLTGIPDAVAIGSGDRIYPPLEALIDDLPQFFNPWRTPATNALTIREPEFLGVSNGAAFQFFTLKHQPLYKQPGSSTPYAHLTIQVREPQVGGGFGAWTDWSPVDDFPAGAGSHFHLDPVTGRINFGNYHASTSPEGHGSMPPAGSEIRALTYRYVAGDSHDFLAWLASWVALTLQPEWTEYQRRKITAEIVSVYRLRGLAQGLHTYLDIYAQTQARPRIALDEGNAVLRAHFFEDGTARLTTVAHSQVISFPAVANPDRYHPVLIHPAAIAVDRNNNYVIVDQGIEKDSDIAELRRPALWKISSTGDIGYVRGARLPVPVPQPLRVDDFFQNVTAVVVDMQDRCSVINNVGEDNESIALVRYSPPDYSPSPVIPQGNTTLPVVHPVDMVLDAAGRFVILDRGALLDSDPPTGNAKPKIVVVSEDPLDAVAHPLVGIVEPTALVRAANGTFIVADAQDPASQTPTPADLWRVTPPEDPTQDWTIAPLLSHPVSHMPLGPNPLIFPTGLVFETPTSLLVCDTGLRWGWQGFQSNRAMAEPAALYRVDLSQTPPEISRVTRERTLVNPVKMVKDRLGKVIIIDRGESLRSGRPGATRRNWRARPNEFGVIVHFSLQRPTDPAERERTRRGISRVIDEQKPGHTSWWLKI